MQLKRAATGSQQQGGVTVVEVSASAKPSEVVGAVLKGAEPQRTQSLWFQRERPIQLAFLFILIFGVTVYFREEIWAFSNDVSKHPIMAYAEQIQIRKWVGTEWLFTSGSKVSAEVLDAVEVPPSQTATTGAQPTPTPKPAAAMNATQPTRLIRLRRLSVSQGSRRLKRMQADATAGA